MENGNTDRTFEIVDLVDADADAGAPGAVGSEADGGGQLEFMVDVMAELAAVRDHGHVMPTVERMQARTVDQSLGPSARGREGIEAPLVVNQSRLKKKTVYTSVPLQVEEPLLGPSAGFGAENNFPRKCFGPGEWMIFNIERIGFAAKAYRFALRRLDHSGLAEDGGGMIAQTVEPVKTPDFGAFRRGHGQR